MVSDFPLEFVSVKTDFSRYVPLSSPDLVLDTEIKLSLTDFVHFAPSTSFQIHNPQCFSSVCSTVMLTASPYVWLVQYAACPLILNVQLGLSAYSYASEIPLLAADVSANAPTHKNEQRQNAVKSITAALFKDIGNSSSHLD